MKIKDVLKCTPARITLYYRWLVFDEEYGFTVYERKPYAKKTIVIYNGNSETEACKALTEEDI